MKKIILFSFFSLLCFIFSVKESSAKYNDSGHYIGRAVYNLKEFKYESVWYPIVDSVTLAFYGAEKYAKSFGEFVPVDTVIKTEFSSFLLERKKVPYFTYLHNGYNQSDQIEQKPTEKKKVYIEFILFFIFFPILIYLISEDIEIGNYDSYFVKRNFEFLVFSLLFALGFKAVLFNLIPHYLKLDYDWLINFFGSHILYSFVSYIVIMTILVLLVTNFKEFFYKDLPIIIFTGIIAAILAGISFEEIYYDSVVYIFSINLLSYLIIAFFVEVIFMYFYYKYRERQEKLKSETEKI